MKKITIIGNGNIGQAINHLLNKNTGEYLIEIYDQDTARNQSGKDLKECLEDSNFIFLCIPSWSTRALLAEISKHLKPETILISLAKGIDVASGETIDEMLEHGAPGQRYALLSGPMFATEILSDKMGFAVLASREKEVFEKVSEIFKSTKLKLEYSKEVPSVAISAVLKNIYSLLFGMFNGFGKDNNTRGFLSSRIVREMRDVVALLKLDDETVLDLSGLGDFIATAGSEYSQNMKSGEEIYHNGNTDYKSEGLVSLPALLKRVGEKTKDLPFLSLLIRILIEQKDPKKEIPEFFEKI